MRSAASKLKACAGSAAILGAWLGAPYVAIRLLWRQPGLSATLFGAALLFRRKHWWYGDNSPRALYGIAKFLGLYYILVAITIFVRGMIKPFFPALARRLIWPTRVLYASIYKLRPPQYAVGKPKKLEVPLADEHTALGYLWSPLGLEGGSGELPKLPTVLVRNPYGGTGSFLGPVFAERGYHVLFMNTRGRFGSSGHFFPIKDEVADGGATLDWIAQQPWTDGQVGMWGISYLGLVQWSAVQAQRPNLKAIVPALCCTDLHSMIFDGGVPSTGLIFRWLWIINFLQSEHSVMDVAKFFWYGDDLPELADAAMHRPYNEVDQILCGEPVTWLREGLDNPGKDSAWWDGKRACCDLTDPDLQVPPTLSIAEWHDFFFSGQIADFVRLQHKQPLTTLFVRNLHHMQIFTLWGDMAKLSLAWYDKHLKGLDIGAEFPQLQAQTAPLVLAEFADGSGIPSPLPAAMQQLRQWPPAHRDLCLFLHPGGVLHTRPVGATEREVDDEEEEDDEGGEQDEEEDEVEGASRSRYTYDPSDPTPNIGGPTFSFSRRGAQMDQRRLERREDVVLFTSSFVLQEPLKVAGVPEAEVYFHSSCEHTDLLVRLCAVDPPAMVDAYGLLSPARKVCGRSMNVCEGMIRLPTCGGSIPHPDPGHSPGDTTDGAPGAAAKLSSRKNCKIYSSSSFEASVEVVKEPSLKDRFRQKVRAVQKMNRVIKNFQLPPAAKAREGSATVDPSGDKPKILKVTFKLFPIAATFPRGSRIRVQVCSGAFPRLSPNLGFGEPLGTAVRGQRQHQEVFHTAILRSCVRLPVVSGGGALFEQ